MSCAPCKAEHQLRHRVTIQQLKAAATRDANNEIDQTLDASWETYCSRNSEFKSRGGSERFGSDMIQAGQTHRVYMRSDTTTRAITPAMRVVFESRKFNILAAVDEDEMRQWVVLDLVEKK